MLVRAFHSGLFLRFRDDVEELADLEEFEQEFLNSQVLVGHIEEGFF